MHPILRLFCSALYIISIISSREIWVRYRRSQLPFRIDSSSVPQTVGMGTGRGGWMTHGLFLAASIDSLSISDCDVKAPSKKDSNHTHVHDMLQLRVDDI